MARAGPRKIARYGNQEEQKRLKEELARMTFGK